MIIGTLNGDLNYSTVLNTGAAGDTNGSLGFKTNRVCNPSSFDFYLAKLRYG